MFAFIRQVFRGFTLVTLCILLLPLAAFATVFAALVFFPLPATLPTAATARPSEPTQIFDIDGQLIGEIATFDQHIPIQSSDIPTIMRQATIASEDKGFYKHKGIDPRGTARALWADFNNKKAVQGGSTITQQYVKLAYTNKERSLSRKIREAVLASQLDRQVDKDEILYRYLNMVYFGDGSYGIGAAAQSYFHKDVKDLDASEAATLVGVIPAPSSWGPRGNLPTAESRRKQILEKMLQQKYLTQEQYDDAVARPLWIVGRDDEPEKTTRIYPLRESSTVYPFYTDYVKQYLENTYGAERGLRSGFKVQTSLDQTMQDAAEKTVADKLKGTKAPLEMAMVSVEPQTGFVKSLVGGRDFAVKEVNLALSRCPVASKVQGKIVVPPDCWTNKMVEGGGSGRQPGSSFKPFVLAAAYERGTQPTKSYPAGSSYRIPAKYCTPSAKYDCVIHNAEGEGGGSASVKEALVHSYNTVYVPLGLDVGLINVAQTAKDLGIADLYVTSLNPSMSLGTSETSPLNMASAYGVFANRGVRLAPTPIVKILDNKGHVVEDNSNRQGKRVLKEEVADNVTDAMVDVIKRGTANPNAEIGRPAAGKTGTTEDFGDAWFVGYTPTLSTAVWMGNSTDRNRMNYRGNTRIYGGTVPAQTWATFMKKALANVPATDFKEPAPIKKVNAEAISNVGTATTVPYFAPRTVRSPITTPPGDYDETTRGGPQVFAPTTTPPSTSPTASFVGQ